MFLSLLYFCGKKREVPLHPTFYCHPIILIWLKYCWKGCKIARYPSIYPSIGNYLPSGAPVDQTGSRFHLKLQRSLLRNDTNSAIYGTPEGHLLSDIYQKRNWNKEFRMEIKTKNISFNRLIISLKRYKIEWKLKQKNRMEIKSRKTEKKLKQQICRLNDFLSFHSNI